MATNTSKQTSEFTGVDAYAIGKRKSFYGHRNWVCWTDKQGVRHAALVSYDTIKRAMLACGTQGYFTVYANGTGHNGYWSIASIWLANLKAGYYLHG